MKRIWEMKMHYQTAPVSNVPMENMRWGFDVTGEARVTMTWHISGAGWRTIAGFAQGVQNQCKIWWTTGGTDFAAATHYCITCISNHPRVTHFFSLSLILPAPIVHLVWISPHPTRPLLFRCNFISQNWPSQLVGQPICQICHKMSLLKSSKGCQEV